MKRNSNFFYDDAYYEGDTRKINNGIYCQTIDRWILVDNYDFWTTLQTAKLLSSKIATTVYILPNNINGMDDTNCLNYMMFNKTGKKIGGGAELIRGQIPMLRQIVDPDQIFFAGVPEDFKSQEGIDILTILKEFTNYLNKCAYAIEMLVATGNYYDNKTFSETYISKDLFTDILLYADVSRYDEGVFKLLRRALYMSNDIDHARASINEIWKNNRRMQHFQTKFYEIIGEEYNLITDEDEIEI